MSFGRRVLSAEEEQRLFAQAEMRDTLTDKALAARWNIPVRTLQSILNRCRLAKRKSSRNCALRLEADRQ